MYVTINKNQSHEFEREQGKFGVGNGREEMILCSQNLKK